MKRPSAILIVDDDEQIRETLRILLRDYYDTVMAGDGREALASVRARPIDMALIDVNLPGMDGLQTLEKIRQVDCDLGVIMISGSDSARKAVSALRMGAYDYITKPFDANDLLSTIKRCADRRDLKNEVEYLKEELHTRSGQGAIISKSSKMKRIFELIKAVGNTSSSVLITGESGTGKELVARAIQSMGDRKDKPLVAVNCGAVPSELMESELFGHEKGSFTGAHARKIGRFEYADGGTVFLDEISTLQMHLQVKLLRVLQEKSFERLGSNVPIKVDIRVIAATNVDLENEVKKGNFREDLYYRLKVVPIELPPLRERKDDIPLLIRHFLERHGRKLNKVVPGIRPDAMAAICEYSWPGNVRELENFIELLVVLAKDGHEISYEDLPVFPIDSKGHSVKDFSDFREACRSFERNYIVGVLNKTNWNRIAASQKMKIHRNTLLMKMKSLGIKEPGFRRRR